MSRNLRLLFVALPVLFPLGACSRSNNDVGSVFRDGGSSGEVADAPLKAGEAGITGFVDAGDAGARLWADGAVPIALDGETIAVDGRPDGDDGTDAPTGAGDEPDSALDGSASDATWVPGARCGTDAVTLGPSSGCPRCGSTWGTACPSVPTCFPDTPCTLANQRAVAISTGYAHSCVVTTDGKVACWGSNAKGQIGDGTVSTAASPTVVPGLPSAVSVSAGYRSTCAVLTDGTVRCWGDAIALGDGGDGEGSKTAPVLVTGLAQAVSVSVGDSHACALIADGTLRCWGDNLVGQLGVGQDVASSRVPVRVPGLTNLVAVSAGQWHTCALSGNGSVSCWGRYTANEVTPDQSYLPTPVAGTGHIVALSAGGSHNCAVTDQGDVQCWGKNPWGQLGDGTSTDSLSPLTVPGVSNAVSVSAGSDYACALLKSGGVQCWGRDGGKLGGGAVTARGPTKPVTVVGDLHAVAVSAAALQTCALEDDGSVRCWGTVYQGSIVDGITSVGFPVELCGFGTPGGNLPSGERDGGTGEVSIAPGNTLALGARHSCVIRPDGTVSCWGDNQYGQSTPPAGTFTSLASAPESIYTCGVRTDHSAVCWGQASPPPAASFATLSGSSGFVCGLLTDGTAKCWGDNLHGETVPPAGTFSAISSGADHVCAIRGDHTIACWGSDSYGQATPPQGSFAAVSAGNATTCAIRMDGTMACWGIVSVFPEGTFKAFVAGEADSDACAIRSDGTVICWDVPNAPSGVFTTVAVGYLHACGVRSDGSVACWGAANTYGQATPPGEKFLSIVSGPTRSGGGNLCGVRVDGHIVCWGSGAPKSPEGTFTAVSLGFEHACGLRTDQTVACWDTLRELTVPPGTYRVVSAGGEHDCALTNDGKPVCWGSNLYGQAAPPDETFVSIACGYRHTCASRADGTVVCWGKIDSGDTITPSSRMFTASSPDGTFTATSVGSHSCGIRPDGRVECWDQGCDSIRATGDGGSFYCFANSGAEVPIPDGPFASLASNLGSFCGLRPTGAVECWGLDPIPTCAVPEDRFTAVAVGAGLGFACGIRASDSGISCWGSIAR